MVMSWFCSAVLLILSALCLCSAENPGVKVKLTKMIMDKGAAYAKQNLISQLKDKPLPDVNGTITMGEENMNYAFLNIRLVDFNYTSLSSSFVPGTGIKLVIKGGTTTLTSDFELYGWLLTDNGFCMLNLTEICITVIIGVQRDKSNKPSIHTVSCEADILGVNLTMIGGVSYIYDAIRKPMIKMIRNDLNQQVCSMLRGQIQQWDQTLNDLKLNILLDNSIGVDLSLVNDPVFTEQNAEIDSECMFYSPVNETKVALTPAAMSFDAQKGSMLTVGLSEASFNSASQVYHSGGGFIFRLFDAHSKSNSKAAALLAGLCQPFGKTKKQLVLLSASKAPTFLLQTNNVTVGFSGIINAHALLPRAQRETLFTARTDICFSAQVSILDSNFLPGLNLTGSISLNSFNLHVEQEQSEAKKREAEIKAIFMEEILRMLNDNLQTGLYIPFRFFKITTSTIKKGFMMVNANMNFECLENVLSSGNPSKS
uniref:Bactericidal permeability-increasing protein n=1 Tax=Leptobrachium leishanense TaxID=445787 RepID=A0A8C5R5Q8_9ANUR